MTIARELDIDIRTLGVRVLAQSPDDREVAGAMPRRRSTALTLVIASALVTVLFLAGSALETSGSAWSAVIYAIAALATTIIVWATVCFDDLTASADRGTSDTRRFQQ